eukprot:5607853-Prymnesium_polylepis.1
MCPANCSGRGVCDDGRCECEVWWRPFATLNWQHRSNGCNSVTFSRAPAAGGLRGASVRARTATPHAGDARARSPGDAAARCAASAGRLHHVRCPRARDAAHGRRARQVAGAQGRGLAGCGGYSWCDPGRALRALPRQ